MTNNTNIKKVLAEDVRRGVKNKNARDRVCNLTVYENYLEIC